jgi:hypothetical protein
MTQPIWMIGGLPCCGVHMIQIPKLMKCSTKCRVCFAPWVKSKNCRRHVAEVFRIWSSKDGYGKSLWTLIKLIKKRIGIIQGGGLKFYLKLYVLFEALWAHCIFRNGARWKPCHPVNKEQKFSKRSPNWEGPYRVIKVIFDNFYLLETLQSDNLPRVINRRCLKGYIPSVWQEAQSALQTMADTYIALRINMADVCIALRY